MALVVADRVQETTTTTGTGTYTLAGAKDGFQSFAAVGDGNTCYYAITDGTDWETGIGTFTLSGTTLARTTIIESSNSDAAVNWGAGSKDIFVTAPADKTLLVGRNLYADNPSSPTAPSATGTNAVAIGDGADATAARATAIGFNTTASGASGVALGPSAVASGVWASAIGGNTDATNTGSAALGYNSQSVGENSVSLGHAYASGTDSFAAAIANNTSTYGATGANSIAIGQEAKASSSNAVSIGGMSGAPSLASNSLAVAIGWATASGSGAFAVGSNSKANATQFNSIAISGNATATYSTAIGKSSDNANASASGSGGIGLSGALAQGQDSLAVLLDARSVAANSVAIGSRARANQIGKFAFANGRFGVSGDVQSGTFILRSDTTDATAEALTTNNSTASTDNQVILPNNSAYSFSGTIIARESATDGSDYASWEIKGALLRDANAASTVLGNGIVNKLYATSGASAWAVALSADTTNGGLKVEVTGAAATNIRWVATVNTSEVTYA
jgi:hypothetical protein